MVLQPCVHASSCLPVRSPPAAPCPRCAAPTVGWACINYHKLYRRPRGMYFSANDRGEMVRACERACMTHCVDACVGVLAACTRARWPAKACLCAHALWCMGGSAPCAAHRSPPAGLDGVELAARKRGRHRGDRRQPHPGPGCAGGRAGERRRCGDRRQLHPCFSNLEMNKGTLYSNNERKTWAWVRWRGGLGRGGSILCLGALEGRAGENWGVPEEQLGLSGGLQAGCSACPRG